MKKIALYIIACVLPIFLSNCGGEKESDEVKTKTLEHEVVISGNSIDTIISVPGLTSLITRIEINADWLVVSLKDASSNVDQLRIVCSKNATTKSRSTDVNVTCANGDNLKLTVRQNVVNAIDDIHDNVTDGAALAPIRGKM